MIISKSRNPRELLKSRYYQGFLRVREVPK